MKKFFKGHAKELTTVRKESRETKPLYSLEAANPSQIDLVQEEAKLQKELRNYASERGITSSQVKPFIAEASQQLAGLKVDIDHANVQREAVYERRQDTVRRIQESSKIGEQQKQDFIGASHSVYKELKGMYREAIDTQVGKIETEIKKQLDSFQQGGHR